MCTYATEHVVVRGSGKAAGVWGPLTRASVYVDHPYDAPIEHTLNIDLFSDSAGRSRQIALELSLESAEALRDAITRALIERSRDQSIAAAEVGGADG
jgi:Family of unknown function (DUF6295)